MEIMSYFALVCLLLILRAEGKRKKRAARATAEDLMVHIPTREEIVASMAAPMADNPGDDEEEDDVKRIVTECYGDLRRQRATGYGPWLSAILDGGPSMHFVGERDEWGRCEVTRASRKATPEMALEAVRRTIGDLIGRRYDLTALYEAEEELRDMSIIVGI